MQAQQVILHSHPMKFVVLPHFHVLPCFLFQSASTLFQPFVASAKQVNHSHDNNLLLLLTLLFPVGLTNPSALDQNLSSTSLLACILQPCSTDILENDDQVCYKSNIIQKAVDHAAVCLHAL